METDGDLVNVTEADGAEVDGDLVKLTEADVGLVNVTENYGRLTETTGR